MQTVNCQQVRTRQGYPKIYLEGAYGYSDAYLDGVAKQAAALVPGKGLIDRGGGFTTLSADQTYTFTCTSPALVNYGGEWSHQVGSQSSVGVRLYNVGTSTTLGESWRRTQPMGTATAIFSAVAQGAVVVDPGTYQIIFSANANCQLLRHSYAVTAL